MSCTYEERESGRNGPCILNDAGRLSMGHTVAVDVRIHVTSVAREIDDCRSSVVLAKERHY